MSGDESAALDAATESAAEAIAQQITAKRDWPVTVKLTTPVEFGRDTIITSLVFRDGRIGDLKGLGTKPGVFPTDDQLFQIASRMCGQPLKVIEMLSAEDGGEVKELALGFWLRSQPGGRTR
jgi:hypothetical protein